MAGVFYFSRMVDYIVVGLGLAGIAFCEELEKQQKTYLVVDQGLGSSSIAGGLYNPVILKRFTPAWEAEKQLELLFPFYENLEKKLGINLVYKMPVYRLFDNAGEQNLWFEASDKPILKNYLSDSLIQNTNKNINAPLGFGKVLHTGRIDTALLIKTYKEFLKTKNSIVEEEFNFDALQTAETITYKNFRAKKIVFAEGFGMHQNPFFKMLPLDGNKGELLTIYAPELKINFAINAGSMIIPLGNDSYRVGTTYHFTDKTTVTTEVAKTEILSGLKKLINCPFEVIAHHAGIRPTVLDRKPLLGKHKDFENIYILNGLGTRGVMLAPYLADMLYHHIEDGVALEKEIDVNRYF